MSVRSFLFLTLFIAGLAQLVLAQPESSIQRKAKGQNIDQDELVSFKSDVPYSKAIQSLGELSKKLDGKILIDQSPLQGKEKVIGINIESMYWMDALELILRSNQLWYNDYPEYLEIVSFEDMAKKQAQQEERVAAPSKDVSKDLSRLPPEITAPATARAAAIQDSAEYFAQVHEIAISSIFFDLNRTSLAESGMDFSVFRGSNLNLRVDVSNAGNVSQNAFNATVSPRSSSLGVTMDAALSMFESEQLGEVIARPQITVRSGSSSTFQIGQDFSVLEKDFSGNTVQKFYPTGTILTVKPKIWRIGEMDFIDIQYRVEKSTFEASAITTVINKTTAAGSLTLLHGEEGYVGGMYSNEETTIRSGVPLLKDLPWWVLGLRYIFGYDSKKVVKRELIVLLKAEILPSVEERAMQPPTDKNIIKDSMKEMDKDLERRTGKKSQ